MRAPLIVLALAGLAACAEDRSDSAEGTKQAGTATQDVEVRKLRQKFKDGLDRQVLRAGGDDIDMPFAPAVAYERDLLGGVGALDKKKKARTWSCVERSARRDSAQVATPVTYVFDTPDGETMTNTGTGFGKVFFTEEANNGRHTGMIGHESSNVAGGLVTEDVVRYDAEENLGSMGGFGNNLGEAPVSSKLIIERRVVSAVQVLSPVEQKTYDSLAHEHEASVSANLGLAIAYVYCETFKD